MRVRLEVMTENDGPRVMSSAELEVTGDEATQPEITVDGIINHLVQVLSNKELWPVPVTE